MTYHKHEKTLRDKQAPMQTEVKSELTLAQILCIPDLKDHSDLIEEAIKWTLSIWTFPSGSGKTSNMNMLRYFFAKEVNGIKTEGLFDKMSISQNSGAMKYQGKYPVVYLNLVDLDWRTGDFYEVFAEKISKLYQEFAYIKTNIHEFKQRDYDKYVNKTTTKSELESALKFLTEGINKSLSERAVILIDGYDIVSACNRDQFFFFQSFFKALKGSSIQNSIVMGAPISFEPHLIFPNNLKVFPEPNSVCQRFFPFSKATKEIKDEETAAQNPWAFFTSNSALNFKKGQEMTIDQLLIAVRDHKHECIDSNSFLKLINHKGQVTAQGKEFKQITAYQFALLTNSDTVKHLDAIVYTASDDGDSNNLLGALYQQQQELETKGIDYINKEADEFRIAKTSQDLVNEKQGELVSSKIW